MTIQLWCFWLRTTKAVVEVNISDIKCLTIKERVEDISVVIEHINS